MIYKAWTIRQGFTLIEIMITMLISSIIALAVGAAFRQTHLVWSRLEQRHPCYQGTRLVLDTLRTELATLYYPPNGIDPNDLILPFQLEDSESDGLTFSFLTQCPCWHTSLYASRPARVTYHFKKQLLEDHNVLMRTEQMIAGDKLIGQAHQQTILKGLSGLQICVPDPNGTSDAIQWTDRFASKDMIPQAVQVCLKWPDNTSGHIKDFKTSILVPCQQKMNWGIQGSGSKEGNKASPRP